MAAVALNTPGRPSELMDPIRSNNWPGEDTKGSLDDHDELQFFQDGLSTGARILSELMFHRYSLTLI